MLNSYGSSITSSFPHGFSSADFLQQCQLCGIKNGTKVNSNNLNQTKIKYELVVKIGKCSHCDLNICDQCLNKTSLVNSFEQKKIDEKTDDDEENDEDDEDDSIDFKPNIYEQHYNILKKEFKKNYNFIKNTSDRANKLFGVLKNAEMNLNELSLIKQQANTKALDLIKQVENEKNELNETIDKIIYEYEKYE